MPVQTFTTGKTESRAAIPRMIIDEAKNIGVPPELALAVAQIESGFDPLAESPAGARGVMQITPRTARDVFGVGADELWDARRNIQLGLGYLKQLYEQYGRRWDLALSHYNGGTLAGGPGASAVPHAFTRKYIADVERARTQYEQHRAPDTPEEAAIPWPTRPPSAVAGPQLQMPGAALGTPTARGRPAPAMGAPAIISAPTGGAFGPYGTPPTIIPTGPQVPPPMAPTASFGGDPYLTPRTGVRPGPLPRPGFAGPQVSGAVPAPGQAVNWGARSDLPSISELLRLIPTMPNPTIISQAEREALMPLTRPPAATPTPLSAPTAAPQAGPQLNLQDFFKPITVRGGTFPGAPEALPAPAVPRPTLKEPSMTGEDVFLNVLGGLAQSQDRSGTVGGLLGSLGRGAALGYVQGKKELKQEKKQFERDKIGLSQQEFANEMAKFGLDQQQADRLYQYKLARFQATQPRVSEKGVTQTTITPEGQTETKFTPRAQPGDLMDLLKLKILAGGVGGTAPTEVSIGEVANALSPQSAQYFAQILGAVGKSAGALVTAQLAGSSGKEGILWANLRAQLSALSRTDPKALQLLTEIDQVVRAKQAQALLKEVK